ncbi:hypothetical protein [Mesorhizobium sp.]|uniref:hypothetical protein n=1 Tax=Mesorhizobium sp. TaxID=1871066 RepID=UPI000FE3D4B0|nr:hypothetical protein [Mesorhizobium sp.]RWQ16072.1 MAG: hypothetical protein EOR92_22600 [Mesorhizobium sp.]
MFQPTHLDQKHCSTDCFAASRVTVPMKDCEVCGDPFKAINQASRPSRWCSPACSDTGRKAEAPWRACLECGEPFQSRVPHASFCCKGHSGRYTKRARDKAKREAKKEAGPPIQKLFDEAA